MGAIIVCMGAVVTALFAMVPGIGAPYATGILSGALTSTPAFSAAQGAVEAIAPEQLGLVSLGHAVAYPFGVIGVVLFVQIMPRILKADIAHERTLIGGAVEIETGKTEKKRFEMDEFGFGAFGLTIVTGVLLGSVKIPLSGEGFSGPCFSLGLTGGPLLMGLILAHFGHIGPISLKIDEHALKSFREFGLMLFLVGAGVEGGVELVEQIAASEYGIMIVVYGFIAGAVMTLIPMIIGYLFGRKICKLPLLNNLGSITGGMTSTPALGTLIGVAGTDDVAAAYASTYPLALVLMVLASQLINSLIL
jgi:putative transport protein